MTVPKHEGVFGPAILFDVRTGAWCHREDEQHYPFPADAVLSMAFAVWVGRPVVVASLAVAESDRASVARRLVGALDQEGTIVTFADRTSDGSYLQYTADGRALPFEADLARAFAYVLVQCALLEVESLCIRSNGVDFDLGVRFVAKGGRWVVEARS